MLTTSDARFSAVITQLAQSCVKCHHFPPFSPIFLPAWVPALLLLNQVDISRWQSFLQLGYAGSADTRRAANRQPMQMLETSETKEAIVSYRFAAHPELLQGT